MESAGKRASTRALSLERLSAVIASSAGRTLPVIVDGETASACEPRDQPQRYNEGRDTKP